jgi:hypothetical protein
MTIARFFTFLVLAAAANLLLDGLLTLVLPDLAGQWPFMFVTVGVFSLLTVIIYYTSIPAAKSDNKARLAQFVMVLTFVKMALSVALVYVYYAVFTPASRSFLFPFFLSYLIFTVFETWYLVSLAQKTSA